MHQTHRLKPLQTQRVSHDEKGNNLQTRMTEKEPETRVFQGKDLILFVRDVQPIGLYPLLKTILTMQAKIGLSSQWRAFAFCCVCAIISPFPMSPSGIPSSKLDQKREREREREKRETERLRNRERVRCDQTLCTAKQVRLVSAKVTSHVSPSRDQHSQAVVLCHLVEKSER